MSSVTPQSSSDQKPPLTFEFTKRKRWADLLITELVDGILFVLSTSCTVLFCAPAVTELLGWRNTDLIDRDLAELVIPDDLATFRANFDDALRGDRELLSYIHLKSNEAALSSKPMLFEIKGHVHHATEDETGANSCLFIMARPYPSRNTAMLNTFIELKMENERLQRRVEELRAQLPAPSGAGTSSLASQSTDPIYATSSLPNLAGASTQKTSDTLSSQYPQDGKFAGCNSTSRNDAEPSTEGSRYSNSGTTEEDAEEGSKKKKAKKAHGAEQYVCIMCGRTDSPEWRKGPLGPKTLCNACGLRWAKQMRKFEEPLPIIKGTVEQSDHVT